MGKKWKVVWDASTREDKLYMSLTVVHHQPKQIAYAELIGWNDRPNVFESHKYVAISESYTDTIKWAQDHQEEWFAQLRSVLNEDAE